MVDSLCKHRPVISSAAPADPLTGATVAYQSLPRRQRGVLSQSLIWVKQGKQTLDPNPGPKHSTHRLLSSSFLGLPYRILNINHNKELLRGLWVHSSNQTRQPRRNLPPRASKFRFHCFPLRAFRKKLPPPPAPKTPKPYTPKPCPRAEHVPAT